jgi:hypothetical protein
MIVRLDESYSLGRFHELSIPAIRYRGGGIGGRQTLLLMGGCDLSMALQSC